MSVQWKRQKDHSNIGNIVLCIWFRCMNIVYSYPDGIQNAFGKVYELNVWKSNNRFKCNGIEGNKHSVPRKLNIYIILKSLIIMHCTHNYLKH